MSRALIDESAVLGCARRLAWRGDAADQVLENRLASARGVSELRSWDRRTERLSYRPSNRPGRAFTCDLPPHWRALYENRPTPARSRHLSRNDCGRGIAERKCWATKPRLRARLEHA